MELQLLHHQHVCMPESLTHVPKWTAQDTGLPCSTWSSHRPRDQRIGSHQVAWPVQVFSYDRDEADQNFLECKRWCHFL
jgi:hypothetical protein